MENQKHRLEYEAEPLVDRSKTNKITATSTTTIDVPKLATT
jgi:hypothetical protein